MRWDKPNRHPRRLHGETEKQTEARVAKEDAMDQLKWASTLNASDFDWPRPIFPTGAKGMAWNYEKGCDEPLPYQGQSNIFTPPAFRPPTMMFYQAWLRAEAVLAQKSKKTATAYQIAEQNALTAFLALEKAIMTFEFASRSPELRKKYIQFLAKEKGLLPNEVVFETVADPVQEDLPLMERIIAEGYRALSKKMHPDAGGSAKDFNQLTEAKKKLANIYNEVKDAIEEPSSSSR